MARPRAHDLLRHVLHDGAATRLPPGLAQAEPGPVGRVLARSCLAAGDAAVDGRPRRAGAPRSRAASGYTLFAVLVIVQTTALWWFTAWLLLLGEVRPRVLLPTAAITSVTFNLFAASANVWMPTTVADNEAQFGMFGIALALVTWFSGAAICILLGACAGPVFAEDPGPVGSFVRGPASSVLTPGAPPSYAAPTREITLHEVLHGSDPP